jgi:hypothetical protein
LSSDFRNALGKPEKSRLHVGRESGDLCGDGFVEDFNSPGHGRLYLNFEIKKRDAPRSIARRNGCHRHKIDFSLLKRNLVG